MIEKIEISNFKSIDTLELDLGRFNVFIGDNGSGKSNILEAVAIGGAASADKLDNEFLSSRGIRVSDFNLMKSAFQIDTNIEININFLKNSKVYDQIITKNFENNELINKKISEFNNSILPLFEIFLIDDDAEGFKKLGFSDNELKEASEALKKIRELVDFQEEKNKNFFSTLINENLSKEFKKKIFNDTLASFIIYSAEQNSLRTFNTESQIKPLGRNGEGLFNFLKDIVEDADKSQFERLKEYLQIIDWFKDLEITYDTFGQKAIKVRDRFIEDETKYLNQYSVNEGFLFILFYLLLFDNKKTPDFFAIDNLEASFHPDLCRELTKILTEITVKNQKQVLITTHSPFVLDGLDLNDNDVRLFVVYRNRLGATKAERIMPLKTNIKLSEAWLKGILGGKPKTFIS